MSPPLCQSCRSYNPPPEDEAGPGECRRRAPRVHTDYRTNSYRSIWPKVWGEQDWCSEFRPADETGECVEKEESNVR
jgi:hypothetical protein